MIEEEMLKAWLRVSADIKENRLLKDFTFNEMIVLNCVYQAKEISFKDLCKKTNMLKSLVNRTINSLIFKEIVIMKDSTIDKRSKVLTINYDNIDAYYEEHNRVIKIMNSIKERIGEEDTLKLIKLLNEVSDAVSNR